MSNLDAQEREALKDAREEMRAVLPEEVVELSDLDDAVLAVWQAALAAREEPQGDGALCECGHTAHMHSALVATPGGRTQAPQGTGWCEETREDASSCGCEKFRGAEEPPDQGTGKFGDPYVTSDGSDDPNRASAEVEGALLTPEEVEKVKAWPADPVERVAIYLSGGDLASWRERADLSQHPGDTDGKDQFRRDARKLLAVLGAREDTEVDRWSEDEWHTDEKGNVIGGAPANFVFVAKSALGAREDTERPDGGERWVAECLCGWQSIPCTTEQAARVAHADHRGMPPLGRERPHDLQAMTGITPPFVGDTERPAERGPWIRETSRPPENAKRPVGAPPVRDTERPARELYLARRMPPSMGLNVINGAHGDEEGVALAAKLHCRIFSQKATEGPAVMVEVFPVPDLDLPINEDAADACREMVRDTEQEPKR